MYQQTTAQEYHYQYQAEKFLPPYFFSPDRPNITSISKTAVRMGDIVSLGYKGDVTHAVLMKAGAVTHQYDMGQRGIKLQLLQRDVVLKQAYFVMPPAKGLVAQASFYMLFLMNGRIPCTKAVWVQLLDAADANRQAPLAGDDTYTTLMNTQIVITPLVNDKSSGERALVLSGWVGAPQLGTLVPVGNWSYIYKPKADATGVDVFKYTVTDGLLSSVGTVTIVLGKCVWAVRRI